MKEAPAWRKSSYSSTQGGECVEVAGLGDEVGIRDSKNPGAGNHLVGRAAFAALLSGLKDQ